MYYVKRRFCGYYWFVKDNGTRTRTLLDESIVTFKNETNTEFDTWAKAMVFETYLNVFLNLQDTKIVFIEPWEWDTRWN